MVASPVFVGGQMTDLPEFTGALSGTELVEIVSPGNAEAGVNYSATTLQIANLGAGGGAVTSVFGRVGAVVSAIGDYTYAQISGNPPAAGADTQVQFNDGGILAGDAGLTWDKTNNRLAIASGGSVGWGQYTRFTANTGVGALSLNGSVSLGSAAGPFGVGNSVSPDYAVLQLVTNGATPFINLMFSAANSDGVWLRTSSTGDANPAVKSVPVTANSDVLFWDIVAAHEESIGFFSWNGIGLIRYNVDGALSVGALPSRFRIYVNSGKDGYDTRMDLRADGTNTFSSLITASATQNSLTPIMVLKKTTDGTPGVGTGIDLRFGIDTAAGNNEVGANIQVVTTDIGAGTEDFDFVFKLMAAGAAAAERVRIKSTGELVIASDAGLSRATAKVVDVNDGTTGNAAYLRTNASTVAALPAASATYKGCRGTVSDANATTFLTVVAGGGANIVPVFCDGTNWRIG